jgi:hypothetical protein
MAVTPPVVPVPVSTTDPVNARILAVSEDRIQGFLRDPFGEIAGRCGVDVGTVVERVVAMLRAGTIRRVRQTLMATSLAQGSLVAWKISPEKLNEGFEYLWQQDPFSGHIVIRSTDRETAGSAYRLWTTLKVPQGFSIAKHCEFLRRQIGAEKFLLMPAKKLFVLGVGHVRRRTIEPGDKAEVAAETISTELVVLSPLDWRVLDALKREFTAGELEASGLAWERFWAQRAEEAGVSLEEFVMVARSLHQRKVIGRFSTFLEHVKATAAGERITQYNGLFHWAVPVGRELEAGGEVGRHYCMTHCYWREGGPDFNNVNIMGVVHGTEKEKVLAHKAAIDRHLAAIGMPVTYTNVFWGGRSEIKPSEISPLAYAAWCAKVGVNPEAMRG